MPVIRHTDSRRVETPAAVMTTLASPAQGGSDQPLWRVDMPPGQAGPVHVIDTQQVWTVLDGGATIDLDGQRATVTAGDTVVIPGALPRKIEADGAAGLIAIVAGAAEARASLVDGTDHGVPPWIV